MSTYQYKGFDGRGGACKGIVEADSVKNARAKLSAEGILAERLVLTGRSTKFPASLRAVVYRELAALLDAGLTLVRAMDLLIDAPEMSDSRLLMAGARDRVKDGMSLADSLRNASGSVSTFECAILETAEESATVAPMLGRLADFLEEQEDLRGRIQSALIYPSIVVGVGICVAVVMLGLLVPKTRDLLLRSNVVLPGLTKFMMGLGQFLVSWGLLALLAAIAGCAWAVFRFRRDSSFRETMDRRSFSLPLFGRGYAMLASPRFCRTLSVLLKGGVALIDGLVLAGRATGSPWVARIAAEEAETVRHGGRLSDAVARIPPLAESLPGWIRIGEASGGLAKLLDSAGQRYQVRWDRFITRCLSFLEPILIIAIGGFVLLVTLSVLLPVLQLSQAVGS